MNDHELRHILHEWEAPACPGNLEERILAKKGGVDWRWLLTGSIRIPVPALVLAVVVLTALFFAVRSPEPKVTKQTGLAGFQPVKQLAPRIVGSNYEVH